MPARDKVRRLGILQSIASGVSFGFLGLFGKQLYERGVRPGELLAFRFIIASLLTFIYLLIRSPRSVRLSLREVVTCAFLGICGYALFSFCFFTALGGLSASLTVLLLYTYPVLVALGGWGFFGETISIRHLFVIPMAGVGLVGLVWGDLRVDNLEYLAFGGAAALFYAIYILVSARLLKNTDPKLSTPTIQAFAGALLASLYLRDIPHATQILQENWLTLLLVAVVCSILAMGLFLASLQKLKSWEVSLLSLTEPLTGVLLAVMILGEALKPIQQLGALAVLCALVWISWPVKELRES